MLNLYIRINTIIKSIAFCLVSINDCSEFINLLVFSINCQLLSIKQEVRKKTTFNFSVPQGSCYGAKIFCLYAGTLSDHIPNNMNLNALAVIIP